MINGMNLDDDVENKKAYNRLIASRKVTKLHNYGGNFDIIRYGDKYVLLNHDDKVIDYYVK